MQFCDTAIQQIKNLRYDRQTEGQGLFAQEHYNEKNRSTCTYFLNTRRMVFLSKATSSGARCWKCCHSS